ncbi:hypothetical protein [Chryseobacterium polytrichastri]|uniref:Uncharacterized protein n=1 Tax=Chryseobacterium polytrichastri TaxID=1302687 RepID=A0A1M6VSP4_9FLAO|nr:hypothetical protein [Chryseobacterium polytrichastri]SHK84532.1 hypothetical protein SAMN05444267_1008133 [Chryseobacterium polytrichastri]
MITEQILVGSYVNVSEVRTKIDEQLLESINNGDIFEIEPIKLNGGWLNDFGFTQGPGYWRYDSSDSENVEIFISNDRVNKIHFNLKDEGYSQFDEEIQDVHMLQFLCFHRLKVMLSLKDS